MNHLRTKKINKIEQYFYQVYFGKSESYKHKILGILLFTLGVILLWNPLGIDDRIGITLIFISIFIFLFFPEKRIDNNIGFFIFFFLIVWLIIMAVITDSKRLDSFFFFTVLGILICKELANGYLTPPLKNKLSFLALVFFSLSIILVAENIISFFNI